MNGFTVKRGKLDLIELLAQFPDMFDKCCKGFET